MGLKPINDTHTGDHISAKLHHLIATLPLENQEETHIWCVNFHGSNFKAAMELNTEIQTEMSCADPRFT